MSSMDYYTSQSSRRHNPVDSICRKLQTIQWRGDREPNTPFQIPKLFSNSYDSPQHGFRHNLESILKKETFHRDEGERIQEKGRGMGMQSSAASQNNAMGSPVALSTPTCNSSTRANITYTITSTLGERRGADEKDLRQTKTWQKHCSIPAGQSKGSPYFMLTRGPHSGQAESDDTSRSSSLSRTFTPSPSTISYNLNFCPAGAANSSECELPYPALVVKRLSMGDEGSSVASENGNNMAEISLICEENLLDTIFHVCDTQRRGRVYVSHIVDYLRHTTCRSLEDSGLEELCNMLDPEHKDVSIDLDTYHAVMREWIDDCRNNREEPADDINQEDSVKLKDAMRSTLLNMTSGSLEAFGGEASRAEFETSELVYCVADLQMSNQKLQEEVRKLKQVVECMEESNQKLAEENEELRNQARVNQQLAQKEKMLKEEVEEMKASLSCTEEGRARASAHSKTVEKENQSLIAKIASLQEENFKVTMEMDDLQRKIKKLFDNNADLQVQIHSFDAIISEKESVILEKNRQTDELKAAVEEYSAITELLRVEKSKLENQLQMILPDLAGTSLSLTGAYRMNQSSLGSLQTELALAQSPLEAAHGVDHFPATMSLASPLDETLDREVLLMFQEPNPEHMALEFKNLLNKLKMDVREETSSVLSTFRGLLGDGNDISLQTVEAELDARRADWVNSLDQLSQYTDSLEHELIKMASNMRRSRTEILHLSARVQEQKNQQRQLCEELEQLKTPQDSREASCQTPAPDEEPGDDLDWEEEFALQDFLKSELSERNCWAQNSQTGNRTEEMTDKFTDRGEEDDGEEKWTVVDTAGHGELRDSSTPVFAVSVEAQIEQGIVKEDSAACTESEPEVDCQQQQEEAAVPLSAHSQAVSIRHPEADAHPVLAHSQNITGEERTGIPSCDPAQSLGKASEWDQTIRPVSIPPTEAEMVSPTSTTHGLDETVAESESNLPSSGEEKEEADPSAADMSHHKRLNRDHSTDRSAAEDSTSLLPVLVEEEESVQDNTTVPPTVSASVAETDGLISSGPNSSLPQSGSSFIPDSQSGSVMNSSTSDPSHPEDLTRSMEATDKHKDEQNETSVVPERDSIAETSVVSDTNDTIKEDKSSLSPSDKEVEAEFQRLALGFKCDMFTLEKRLRLEERSRDLAEENVRREVSSCQGLLQALIPLCEDDSQSMEIILRLQKNLEILNQSMTRVSSRSEMLGAIHQENRIGKAVEVMIQHVENLRRTYTKEHAELLELREALMQNERSFGSQTEKDDFRGKKPPTPYYKTTTRRVSIAGIPRAGGSNMHFDLAKTQDCSEAEAERLTRRSPCPSPSSSPTSTDPGVAQSLSHNAISSRATGTAVARGSRGPWLWLAIVIVLAGLLALLASLVMQPAVDAAPVGTGDSWTTIQQLLWPYTGLRHNGQPPV